MKTHVLQSSFNNGVLDDRMAARLDIKQYYQGVLQGENVQFLPQGGARRRPGFEYIATPTTNGRLVSFEFNTDQVYLLCFSNLKVEIYRNDALVDTVVTPYVAADLFELDFAQTADTMIIVHEDYAPRTLVRGATDADFTLSTISFNFIPQYDFNDASSPTPVSCVQTVQINGMSPGNQYKLTLEGVDTDIISYLDVTTAAQQADSAEEMRVALQDLAITGNTGVSVAYTSGGTFAALFTVTFAGSSADDYRTMGGRYTDGLSDGDEIIRCTTTTSGTSRKENVWSSTRGWPRTVTFFEGRLWFGGSRQRPHTIWGSRVNNFYNFDPGKSRADQAIDITLDTDQINRIQSIIGGRSLSVFTIGGEFVFKSSASEPITPENVAIIPQTNYGSKRINPVSVGGAQMYIQRTGKALREFVFNFDVEAYDSASLTLLSPNIISDPVDMSVQRGTAADDATYVYLTNDDGTLAVFNSAKTENVAAWAKWTTDGLFKSCAVVLDELYVLVQRTVNSATVYYIEKANLSAYTDSAVLYPSGGTTLTGLSHLNTESVRVKVDSNRILPNETVATGSITLPFASTSAEVGLDFTPIIETMPIVQNQGAGFDLDDEKRVSRVTLELYESLGVRVEGYALPDTVDPDGIKTPHTGRKGLVLTGWSKRPTITITQTDPLPMTILGIEMEVNG